MAPADARTREYEDKAAFLLNFAKYTTWPVRAYPDKNSPFVVAVVGKDPFGKILDKALAGKKARSRPIQIKRYASVRQVGSPHMLFVGALDSKSKKELLKKMASTSTLVIADGPGDAGKGTTIGFYLDRGKVRFEISERAAKAAGLSMSSQLLKLAKLVDKK